MKKLNICILLSNFFDPDFPSRPAITEIYGEYLPSFGHKITWLMPTFKKNDDYNKNKYKKVTIFTIYYGNSFFKIYNSLIFYFKKFCYLNKLLKKKNYEIIHVRNNIFDSILVLLLKKRYNFLFIFQYSFPKGIYYKKSSNRIAYTFGRIQKIVTDYILKKSDFILPISEGMKKELIDNNISENKMMTLPMGVNINNFSQKNRHNLRKKYQLNKKQVFLYIGTLDISRNLEIIIKAFSKVKKYNNNICLLIVGSGNSETKLKKLTSNLNLNDYITFTGTVSYFDIPDHIFTADICLSPIPPRPVFRNSSPTKLFEYMALEKPIVANNGIIEQEKVLKESKCGILVNFDINSFTDGMIELLKNPEKSRKMGQNGRKWVINNRSYNEMALKLEKKYFELIMTH